MTLSESKYDTSHAMEIDLQNVIRLVPCEAHENAII